MKHFKQKCRLKKETINEALKTYLSCQNVVVKSDDATFYENIANE